MANSVIRISLSSISATAADAVNGSDEFLESRYEAGPNQLSDVGSTNLGGACTDYSGNVYVSDVDNHIILKIDGAGNVTVVAGEAGTSGNNGTLTNVPAEDARFNGPRGLACDKSGNIYIADTGNNQIRVLREGYVSTIAGAGDGASGFEDGTGGDARFDSPSDVCVTPSGILYVTDVSNNSVRQITDGTVYTFAGSTAGDSENVAVTTYDIFTAPSAIAVDERGDLYVCDNANYKIKRITPEGWVYHFSGSGSAGTSKGTDSFDGTFSSLSFSDVDQSGNLYVVDQNEGHSRLIKFDRSGVQQIVSDFDDTNVDAGFADNVVAVAVNPTGVLSVVVGS